MTVPKLPLRTVNRIMHQATTYRIKRDAKETVNAYAVDYILLLTSKAQEMSEHAGRKTIFKGDIELAARLI